MKRALLLPLLAGCFAADDVRLASGENSIVFGIEQRSGTTTAGWSLLSVGRQAGAPVRTTSNACQIEAIGERVGQPRVDDGTAIFTGGTLPGQGLRVVAGEPSPRAPGGWATGDVLGFSSRGFAAPDVGPLQLAAPSPELVVSSPDGDVALTKGADFVATWDPKGARADNVLVSLLTEGKVELRCFFPRAAGQGIVTKESIAELGAVKGTLTFATQRQATLGGSDWTVYVVAAVTVREQPFTVAP